ncbi:bifunctional nicotinamide-nucleotide adenylyltransferase/Nudix hydroxylase [Piscinibacterium candidicorallinum]|uniref:Bifunctional nicotinamide-nucleotide adenylyltransferase/Nudix hydroxylase n=1 Tax=Piscinibacterium candidicorallinum TaxID=1793872 RepID=A0ABV7H8A9_9BURK
MHRKDSYALAVVIGRFSPFHNGHLALVRHALALADQVLIVLGSAAQPRTVKNPFLAAEREQMIRACLPDAAARLHFAALPDNLYSDQAWVTGVQRAVDASGAPATRVCLVGYEKDESSYYLKMFPQWRLEPFALTQGQVSATQVRDILFADLLETADGKTPATEDFATQPLALKKPDAGRDMLLASWLPAAVLDFIRAFRRTDAFEQLVREHTFLQTYRSQFVGLKYPPIFVTVDAVVVQSGHVLLVQRGAEPGKGLWALPGGFLDANERIADAVIRELVEETRIKVPAKVLRGSIKASQVFDHPGRSQRGRTITHAHLIVLEDSPAGLPEIKGGSDARRARWVPLAVARNMSESFFEDHGSILEHFVANL